MRKHFAISLGLSGLAVVAALGALSPYETLLWCLTAVIWLGVALEELMLLLYTNGDDDAAD